MPRGKKLAAGVLLYLLIFAASLLIIAYIDVTIGALFLVVMLAEPFLLSVLTPPNSDSWRLPMNKHIVSYICVLAAAILFMLYLDGLGGAFFVVALIAAPFISLLLALNLRHGLSCTITADMCSLSKGDSSHIVITVSKRGFLPSPFVTVKLYRSGNFTTESATVYRFVFGFGQNTRRIELDCKAVLWGRGTVTVADVCADDFMGLFSFSIADTGCEPCKISVSPRLADCNIRGDFMKQLTESAAFDDSEETTSDTNVFNGTPGYEHKKYAPGDSLKSINWKLSAKRDELLVRKPEGSNGAPQTIIIDGCHGADRFEEQKVLEAALAIAKHFAEAALPCRLYLLLNGAWECTEFKGVGDVEALRFRMTDYSFSADNASRIPDFSAERISRTAIFTANPDGILAALADRLTAMAVSVKIISPTEVSPCTAEAWKITLVNGEYDFMG